MRGKTATKKALDSSASVWLATRRSILVEEQDLSSEETDPAGKRTVITGGNQEGKVVPGPVPFALVRGRCLVPSSYALPSLFYKNILPRSSTLSFSIFFFRDCLHKEDLWRVSWRVGVGVR
jgi:hypothetical protein